MRNRQRQRSQGRAAPATELQLAALQEMTQEVVEVWDEPITAELKTGL